MDEIALRRMSVDDTGLLDHVADGVFADPIVPERLQAYLRDPGNLMVVALANRVVIARVAAVIHAHVDKPADLYLDELSVAETYRRRGIANRLIAEVTAWAAELGCADCWLATEADNVGAQQLYERLGTAKPCILYYWPFADG